MSVAIADFYETVQIPNFGASSLWSIDPATENWIVESTTVFYAWHWYIGAAPADAVQTVQALSQKWNVPSFATEFMDCRVWNAALAANISVSYFHYSSYCNTGPGFGNRKVPDDTFGACILGWAGGDSSKNC